MGEERRWMDAMQQASREFLNALAAGQAFAVDRFGSAIREGDKLLYHMQVDTLYDVVAIKPVFDPNLPPGMLDVVVRAEFPIRMMANQRSIQSIVLRNGEPDARGESQQSSGTRASEGGSYSTDPETPPDGQADPPPVDSPIIV